MAISNDMAARLMAALGKCRFVSQFDDKSAPESHELTIFICEMEQIFRKILDENMPELCNAEASEQDLNNALTDIGDSLRHLLYHVKNSRFFAYLWDQVE